MTKLNNTKLFTVYGAVIRAVKDFEIASTSLWPQQLFSCYFWCSTQTDSDNMTQSIFYCGQSLPLVSVEATEP